MNLLPSVTLYEIVKFVPLKDIFKNLICVSKSIHDEIVTSDYLLGILCEIYFKSSRRIRLNYPAFKDLLIRYFTSKIECLDYLGFATTGGVKDNLPYYSFTNLYIVNESVYITRENVQNVNTAGVIELTQFSSLDLEDIEFVKLAHEKFHRMKNKPFNKKKISMEKIKRFADYMQNSPEFAHIICNVMKIPIEVVNERFGRICQKFNHDSVPVSKLRRRLNNENVLIKEINYDMAIRGNKLAIINKISVCSSRTLRFPVQTFLVFISEDYVDVESSEFDKYNNMKNYEDLKQICQGELRDPVVDVIHQTCYCEFYSRSKNLKPVIWGKITGTDIDCLSVSLKECFSGNFLYTKLIDGLAQNLPNTESNLYCNFVSAEGRIIEI